VTRRKYDGGFRRSLEYLLSRTETELDNVDRVAIANYGDPVIGSYDELIEIDNTCRIFDKEQVAFVPHHLSHAYATFWPSPFEQAIIMVFNNEGNIIGERKYEDYWKNRMERASYFIGRNNDIQLIDRDLDDYDTPSLGEVYSNFTTYLGLGNYQNAGKTMGLASYGNADRFEEVDIFTFRDGNIQVHIDNYHKNGAEGISKYATENDYNFPPRREPEEEITQRHKDLAAWIQSELEKAILQKVEYLIAKTGINNLCVGGGVAYNCVMNQRILRETDIENIFIQPAAGDQGLGIGNCYYVLSEASQERHITDEYTTYLGGKYESRHINRMAELFNVKTDQVDTSTLLKEAVNALVTGEIIAWYQGRSEMGPRALGNRSILADPRDKDMKDRINNEVKHREDFRPFAPSVLLENAQDFFEMSQSEYPFMIVTADVVESKRSEIPSVTHVDGTARIQTVSEDDNPRFHSLLSRFYDRTSVPLLLNTSFNLSGEPIVETPFDALYTFCSTELDKLFIEDLIVTCK